MPYELPAPESGGQPNAPPPKRRRSERAPVSVGEEALDRLWLRVVCQAAQSSNFPPRPEVELFRRSQVLRLRRFYASRISEELGCAIVPPRESFNRWLLGRANRRETQKAARSVGKDKPKDGFVEQGQGDPLLGSASSRHFDPHVANKIEDDEVGHMGSAAAGLRSELLAALPVQLPYAETWDDAGQCANLRQYATAVLALFENDPPASEVCALCAAAIEWASSDEATAVASLDPSLEAFSAAERLENLRCRSAPAMHKRFACAVSRVCLDLEQAADEAVLAVRTCQSEVSGTCSRKASAAFDMKRGAYLFSLPCDGEADGDGSGSDDENEEPQDGRFMEDRGEFIISAGRFELLAKALRRTVRRVEDLAPSDDKSAETASAVAKLLRAPEAPWDLVFCLLCRYDALCGPGNKEGGGLHAAAPSLVFDSLVEFVDAGAPCVECFASPLNCQGGRWRYCSLFQDLDVFFGSLGSFLDIVSQPEATVGIFELNPPFIPGVMMQAAEEVLNAMDCAQATGSSLQFAVILPLAVPGSSDLWPHGASPLERLLDSPFARAATRSRRWLFQHGMSFRTDKKWPPFTARTRCVLLQSDAAAGSLPSTLRTLRNVCEAWRDPSEAVLDSGGEVDSDDTDSVVEALHCGKELVPVQSQDV